MEIKNGTSTINIEHVILKIILGLVILILTIYCVQSCSTIANGSSVPLTQLVNHSYFTDSLDDGFYLYSDALKVLDIRDKEAYIAGDKLNYTFDAGSILVTLPSGELWHLQVIDETTILSNWKYYYQGGPINEEETSKADASASTGI
jgi:hypothetical protein